MTKVKNEDFGFVAEPRKTWLCSPATLDLTTGEITCHDLSGFIGSWKMKEGGKFFPCVTDSTLCPDAMQSAQDFCDKMNTETKSPGTSNNTILEQSQLALWQNYCDKKMECEMLRDMLKDTLDMLEYAHITGEWAYNHEKVSNFIEGMYKKVEKQND